MSVGVSKSNAFNQQAPETLEQMVSFIHFVAHHPDSMIVQVSNLEEELVREVASHFKTNFFGWEEIQKSGMNPFTTLCIGTDGQVRAFDFNQKSKIILYAKRPNTYHQSGRPS